MLVIYPSAETHNWQRGMSSRCRYYAALRLYATESHGSGDGLLKLYNSSRHTALHYLPRTRAVNDFD
jgi:hypothetical protein